MSRLIDLTGQRFGSLRVESRQGKAPNGKIRWRCICDCGRVALRIADYLHRDIDRVASCGCRKQKARRHGHAIDGQITRAYRAWCHMLERCNNPTCQAYKHYGARGIKVCAEWSDYKRFLSDMGDAPLGLTLERIDNDGPYEQSNCCWATRAQQSRNKRSNIMVTLDGERLCLSDWAKRKGLNRASVYGRIKVGWSPQKALTTPIDHRYSHSKVRPE